MRPESTIPLDGISTQFRSDLARSEKITINGANCYFVYLEKLPIQIYLFADLPRGVVALEADGARWRLERVADGVHAIPSLKLHHIDEFGGVGRWGK